MHAATGSLRTYDDLTLFYRSWAPGGMTGGTGGGEVRAVVILSHGYAEHSGRYEELAGVLTGAGYAVCALDHRGHGGSEGVRANVPVFRCYVDDLGRFIERVREKHPRAPRFLLGHSMGGLVALQLVLEHPEKVDGVAVSAAFIRNAAPVSPLLARAARLIGKLAPQLPVQALDTDALARDKRVVERYRSDPLVYHGKVKARLGAELLHTGPYILERASSIWLPLLLMHALDDQLASVRGSQELFERVSSKDKRLELYEGAFHEIFNDYGKEGVQRDLLGWLEGQVQQRAMSNEQ